MKRSSRFPVLPIPNNKQPNPWYHPLCLSLKRLSVKLFKKPVPETTLALHLNAMLDTINLAKNAQAIDNDKFSQPEFLLLIKIKYCLAKGIEGYESLEQGIQYLKTAIEATNSYLIIDQTELRYRSSKQQEFYNYVESLLQQSYAQEDFKKNINAKLDEILPSLKTEEGKTSLQGYCQELNKLAEHPFGLKLLSLFKAYQLADYSILKRISDLTLSLKEQDLMDVRTLGLMIIAKYNMFEKLGEIIEIDPKYNNPASYAKILQYIALDYRHKKSYDKFQELLAVMRKWLKPYQTILKIRQEHPPSKYKQPKEFRQMIPGEDTYNKYKGSLTDKRTGYTYLELEG